MIFKNSFKSFSKISKQSNKYVFLTLFFSFICIIVWSFQELSFLSTDFGKYYADSRNIGINNRLYDEIFAHKGPTYFYFIKLIGDVIGWGLIKSVFTLILSLLVFYLPIYFLVFKYISSNKLKILVILMSTSLLLGQNPNSSIGFFKEGTIIISLIPIFFGKLKLINFLSVNFFFWLSFFTRIDSLVYLPFLIFYSISFYFEKKNIFDRVYLFIVLIFTPVLFYIYFANYFHFNFDNYWLHNFEFNFWYRDNIVVSKSLFLKLKNYLFRPKALNFTLTTFIAPYLILNLANDFRNKSLFNLNLSKKDFIKNRNLINKDLLLILISFFLYLIVGSDRNYYSLMFLCPLILFLIYRFKSFRNLNKVPPLVLIFLFGINSIGTINNLDLKYKIFQESNSYQKIVRYAKKNNLSGIDIVGGGRGWPFIISPIKNNKSITDDWFYSPSTPFLTKGLLKQHKDLVSKPSGYIFWMHYEYFDNPNRSNKFINEILLNSELVEDQGDYKMLKIK